MTQKTNWIKHYWRRGLTGLLVLVVAIALSGCRPIYSQGSAAQPSQLVYSILKEPNSFNYILIEGTPNVNNLIYTGLLVQNGLTGEVEPGLAESWEISTDKRRIILTLRDGLKWSDGEPLTVDDIIFTYDEIYLNEKIESNIRDFLRIGERRELPRVRKLDERRVEFTTPQPFAPFLRNTGLTVLPAHALREAVRTYDSQGNPKFFSTWGTDADPAKIICNGPYMLEDYIPGQRIIFRRNPYFWRQDERGNHQPYIEKIVWQIVESTDNALVQFRSGGLDYLDVSPQHFSLLKREEDRGKFTIHIDGPRLSTAFLTFNLNQARNDRDEPFVDPIKSRWFNLLEFRQAIAYAIDRQKMINNVYQGLGEMQNSPIYKQTPYFIGPEAGLKVYDYNPQKSKDLLKKAGFIYDESGKLFDASGNRVRFALITDYGDRSREAIAIQIQQDLAAIGIKVDLTILNFNTVWDRVHTQRKWESYLGGIPRGTVEPHYSSGMWLTKGGYHTFNLARQVGEPPMKGWKATDWELEIERLYIQGALELDEAKRKEIYAQSQRVTQENLPFIYLVNPLLMTAVRDRIQQRKSSVIGGDFWNVYELRIVE